MGIDARLRKLEVEVSDARSGGCTRCSYPAGVVLTSEVAAVECGECPACGAHLAAGFGVVILPDLAGDG